MSQACLPIPPKRHIIFSIDSLTRFIQRVKLEQVARIELASSEWKSEIIPIIPYLHFFRVYPECSLYIERVPPVGLEPTLPKKLDFKSSVSTDSTTEAYIFYSTVYPSRDLNSHARRHQNLNLACLPISPKGHRMGSYVEK